MIPKTKAKAEQLNAEYAALQSGNHRLCLITTAEYGMKHCWCFCSSCWSYQAQCCTCKLCPCRSIHSDAIFDLVMIARRARYSESNLFVFSYARPERAARTRTKERKN